MGMDLELYVNDNSIERPFLSRRFKEEIISEHHLKFKDFLTEDEIEIISPNPLGEIYTSKKKKISKKKKSKLFSKLTDIVKGVENFTNNPFNDFLITSYKVKDRERDPKKLKETLLKVENQLIIRSTELPLLHCVYNSRDLEEEVSFIMINNIESHFEGDLYYYDNYSDVRNKIHVKSYLEDFGKIDFFIDVNPQIEVDGKNYFTKTFTKAEEFQDSFNKCYDFLDLAIDRNKKVLFEFG